MRLTLCPLALALAITPGLARANISAPWSPGDALAEPAGALAEVQIIEEQLSIDLRPLAGRGPATARASYRVRSPHAPRRLDLRFVTPGLERGTVKLDGRPISGAVQEVPAGLPGPWSEALSTPDPDGGDLNLVVDQPHKVIRFAVDLQAGKEHLIEVAFSLRPARTDPTDAIHATHQLGYLLAPARQWGSFGKLEVTVQVPDGWQLATRPALRRDGAQLKGVFQGIPADLLAVSLRKPAAYGWGWILPLGGVLLGLLACFRLVRRAGRRCAGASGGKTALAAAGTTALSAALPLGLGGAGLLLWQSLPDPAQLSTRYFYDFSVAIFLFGPLAAIALGVAALVMFLVVRGRTVRLTR